MLTVADRWYSNNHRFKYCFWNLHEETAFLRKQKYEKFLDFFHSVADKAFLHFRTNLFWNTLWSSKDSDCTVHNLIQNQIKLRAYRIHFWDWHWFESDQNHRKRAPRFRSFSRKGSSCFKAKIVFRIVWKLDWNVGK